MATAPSKHSSDFLDERTKPPFLRRVRIRGYKSIAFCDVSLQPLTILVGRNAAGKSNFLDALAFLRDGVWLGIAEAVRRRGGASVILSRSAHSDAISIEVEAAFQAPPSLEETTDLPSGTLCPYEAQYHLKVPVIGSALGEPEEYLRVNHSATGWHVGLTARHHQITGTGDRAGGREPPHASLPAGQLSLNFLGSSPYRGLAEAIRTMGFYNFQPEAIRKLQRPFPGTILDKDGRNVASVIGSLKEIDPDSVQRVREYLSAIADEVEHFDVVRYGEYETVRFRLRSGPTGPPLEFDAASMSDGTLRALAALMAVFQIHLPTGPSVIGIEEPETALHPAAMRALVDALDEATLRTQILLTTHSAEMLDNPTIRPENVRVVEMIDGQTTIGPVDDASVEIVRRNLDTLGGLERQNQLAPNLDDLDRQRHLSQDMQQPKE